MLKAYLIRRQIISAAILSGIMRGTVRATWRR